MSRSIAERRGIGRLTESADFVLGIAGIAVAGIALWLTRELSFQVGFNVGPGYLPRLAAGVIALLSLALIVNSLRGKSEILPKVQWRPLIVVVLSVVVFGSLIERAGLVLSCIATVAIGSFAEPRPVLWKVAILAVCLSVAAVLVFVEGLGVPFKVLPL